MTIFQRNVEQVEVRIEVRLWELTISAVLGERGCHHNSVVKKWFCA